MQIEEWETQTTIPVFINENLIHTQIIDHSKFFLKLKSAVKYDKIILNSSTKLIANTKHVISLRFTKNT